MSKKAEIKELWLILTFFMLLCGLGTALSPDRSKSNSLPASPAERCALRAAFVGVMGIYGAF